MTEEDLDGDLKNYFTSNQEELLIIGALLLLNGSYSDDEKWHWFVFYSDHMFIQGNAVKMSDKYGYLTEVKDSYSLMLSIGKELKQKGYGKKTRKA